METVITGILFSAIAAGGVLIIVGIGELMAERSGVLNLSLEGIMAMGGMTAILVVNKLVPNPYVGLLAAMLVGLLLGAFFAFGTVTIRADQVLAGLALGYLLRGLAGQLGNSVAGQRPYARFVPIDIPVLSEIPFLGDVMFNHNILVYFAYLVLPALCTYLLFATRHGINLRAVGENPAAADATGVKINQMRYIYVCVGGALAGMGGAYLTLALTPGWTEGVIAGKGWIAIALVLFSGWRPFTLVLGALLFGSVTSIGYIAQIYGWGIPSALLGMLPYVSTIILLVASILIRGQKENKRLVIGPSALTIPYYRE